MEKLVSLCFPIYNRIETFKYTFSRTIDEVRKISSDEVEVVVSVNPHKETFEETKKYLAEMQKQVDIVVCINERNIGIGGNARKVFELASGKYIWLIGDDDFVLPGCLERLLKVAHEHPDIGWFYLAYGRLDDYPENNRSKIGELTSYLFERKGYIKEGKKAVIQAHNCFGGKMLFSSANLFLRSIWQELAKENPNDCPQLGAAFACGSRGAVYFDNNINVVAGGQTTWSSQADYSEAINYFRDMYFAIGHGFSKAEVDYMIKYRMRHDALSLWFRIYRMLFQGNKYGRKSLAFFFRTMPLQTIITTLLLPVIACYLPIRHTYRNYLRKKACIEYKLRPDADQYILSRLSI